MLLFPYFPFPLYASFCLLVNWFVSSFFYTVFLFLDLRHRFVVAAQLLSHVQLWLHGLQYARLHYLLEFAEIHVHGIWCTMGLQSVDMIEQLNWLMSIESWCHPTISSSVVPFSSCLHSFPESGSFPESQFFASGGHQSIGTSASASVLPMNIQDWFPLRWTGWISLQSKGLSSGESPWSFWTNTTVQKHPFLGAQLSLQSNAHMHTGLLEKTALTRWTFRFFVCLFVFQTDRC